MKTLLLLSILLVALAFPVWAARAADPRRGIRKLLVTLFIFNALYLFYVTRMHPELFVPVHPMHQR